MKKQLRMKHLLLLCLLILVSAAGILLMGGRGPESRGGAEENATIYSRHYALITGDSDDEFWKQVYESAREAAAEKDIYVEWFGKNLSVSYSVKELLHMAIRAGVDGIILQAPDGQETEELINESVDAGIPVVTVLSDCQSSLRQAYVGVNNYEIGLLYGEEIVRLILHQFSKNIRIMIVVGAEELTSSQSLALLGMREYINGNLPKGYFVNVETELIPQESSFATEEYINSMFVSSAPLPDIMICLDERGTRCSYLSAVDHNRVGETAIVGYYSSKDTLAALEKGILDSILSVDAEEMGKSSVEVLLDYQEYGYANTYNTVKIQLLDKEDAARILERDRDNTEEGQE
ncbi:MAG: substrate-binding domain-containing protein [Lachnospiraceae bacterium]|nr:substrate-binding domain-containing protein [Lachnospiraceae bacterium]